MRRQVRVVVVAVVSLTLAAVAGAAERVPRVALWAPELYAAGKFPIAIGSGDFSGDGVADLAVVNQNSNSVTLLRGKGSGRFEAWLTRAVGIAPDALAVGDLDGNLVFDVAVANKGSGFLSVLYGPAGDRVDVPVAKGATAVAVGKFSGDGAPDLAVANGSAGTVSLLLNQGERRFSGERATTMVGDDPEGMVARDLDGDRNTDLVVANHESSTLAVLYGNGARGFGSVQTGLEIGTTPTALAVGDLNQDGILDLVATLRGSSKTHDANMVAVRLGTGNRSFSSPLLYGKTSAHPSAAVVGDLDLDGHPDVIVGTGDSAQATILYGDGQWTGPPLPRKLERVAAGRPPRALVADYLNRDSQLDLAFADAYLGGIAVVLGDGTGGLREPPATAVGNLPVAAAVADLDGDLKPDAVTANSWSADVSLLRGTGNVRKPFQKWLDLDTGSRPNDVAVADIDVDGKADVALASIGSNNATVWWDAGTSTPVRTEPETGNAPHAVAVGDLNQDGRPDLVTANYGSHDVTVLLNKGGRSFATTAQPAGLHPISTAIADVTGDGRADIAVADFGDGSAGSGRVALLAGRGNGNFDPAKFYDAGGVFPTAIASGLLNGDQVADLVVTNRDASTVSVLLAGSLSSPLTVPVGVGYKPVAVAVGYLNDDGYLDLAVANMGGPTNFDYCKVRGFVSGGISILAGDGTGVFQPAGSYASLNDACDVALGDLNNDGKLDITVPATRTRVAEAYLNETP